MKNLTILLVNVITCGGRARTVYLGLISLLAIGCSENQTALPENTSALLPASSSLVLYSWAEYFSPEVLAEFQQKSGIEIDYKFYENNDEMFETLKSNSHLIDVVVMDDSSMERAIHLRLLQKIDRSLLSNYRNIDKKYAPELDQRSQFSVPYTWGTTLLAYRSDIIDLLESEKSWDLLFDPRYEGKVSMLDERLECLGVALRLNGRDAGSSNGAEIKGAADRLVMEVTKQRIRFGSDNDMKSHLKNGDSWIAMMYSGDAALIAEESEGSECEIEFFIPREGATLWTDGFAIPRDCPSVSVAHQFIDFMSDARIAGETSNHLWYATPNMGAKSGEYLNAELASDTTIYPPNEVIERCDFAFEGNPERVRALNAGWREVKEAVGRLMVAEVSEGDNNE